MGQARRADRAGDGATVGMYGDLQGIAGKLLQEIEGLEFSSIGLNIAQETNQLKREI